MAASTHHLVCEFWKDLVALPAAGEGDVGLKKLGCGKIPCINAAPSSHNTFCVLGEFIVSLG